MTQERLWGEVEIVSNIRDPRLKGHLRELDNASARAFLASMDEDHLEDGYTREEIDTMFPKMFQGI